MKQRHEEYHFFDPLTMYSFPSADFTAVASIPATSLPAPGSVIAMQLRARPVSKSGMNLSCNCLLPNLNIGGTPNAIPAVRDAPGPDNPLLPIYPHVMSNPTHSGNQQGKQADTNLIGVDQKVQIIKLLHF